MKILLMTGAMLAGSLFWTLDAPASDVTGAEGATTEACSVESEGCSPMPSCCDADVAAAPAGDAAALALLAPEGVADATREGCPMADAAGSERVPAEACATDAAGCDAVALHGCPVTDGACCDDCTHACCDDGPPADCCTDPDPCGGCC